MGGCPLWGNLFIIEMDSKGKVQQKLIVLPYLSELLYNNCMIGNFINSGIYIKADYFVGNTKAILSAPIFLKDRKLVNCPFRKK